MKKLTKKLWLILIVVGIIIVQSCSNNPTAPSTGDSEGPGEGNTPDTNLVPVIQVFTADSTFGYAPLNVTFSWSAYDPDGDPITCELDANSDGVPEWTTCNPSYYRYTFNSKGIYNARLTVIDTANNSKSKTITIKVCEEHFMYDNVHLSSSDDTTLYFNGYANDTLIFNIWVIDGNDVSEARILDPDNATIWFGEAFVDTTDTIILPETGTYGLYLENTAILSGKDYGFYLILKECP